MRLRTDRAGFGPIPAGDLTGGANRGLPQPLRPLSPVGPQTWRAPWGQQAALWEHPDRDINTPTLQRYLLFGGAEHRYVPHSVIEVCAFAGGGRHRHQRRRHPCRRLRAVHRPWRVHHQRRRRIPDRHRVQLRLMLQSSRATNPADWPGGRAPGPGRPDLTLPAGLAVGVPGPAQLRSSTTPPCPTDFRRCATYSRRPRTPGKGCMRSSSRASPGPIGARSSSTWTSYRTKCPPPRPSVATQ
ncbi:hypothetical protein SAMN05442782_0394 [Streptomyces sp. OK228]|nr:hypothetical protein SAMN05442782_0394 [Streptomyces sp. OK228]